MKHSDDIFNDKDDSLNDDELENISSDNKEFGDMPDFDYNNEEDDSIDYEEYLASISDEYDLNLGDTGNIDLENNIEKNIDNSAEINSHKRRNRFSTDDGAASRKREKLIGEDIDNISEEEQSGPDKINKKPRDKKKKEEDVDENGVPLWVKDPEKFKKKKHWAVRVLIKVGNFLLTWGLLFCVIGVFVLGIGVTVIYSFSDSELDERFASLDLEYTSTIFANSLESNGYVEYENLFSTQNRIWISADEMPDHLKDALISTEDKRFYKHNGVDVISTTKATFNYLLAKVTGKSTDYLAGGSTLTQQLIKGLTQEDDKSEMRKIKEMLRALYIERRYSKDQILEYYLNTVYFNNNCNGIYAAAQYYFNKEVQDLNPLECATIICITKSPTNRDPYTNPDNNKKWRDTVLWNMCEQGYLTREEYDHWTTQELELRDRSVSQGSSVMSWFSDMVFDELKQKLIDDFGYTSQSATNYIYTGGLRIYTTLVTEYQEIADNYFSNEDNYIDKNAEVKAEIAFELLDPATGNILAVVGGRGEKTADRLNNRVTSAIRQPGSSIKPLTAYGYAIENNLITQATMIDDTPLYIDKETGKGYPTNYDNTYEGLLDVKRALSRSLNTPSAKVVSMIGYSTSYNFAKTMLGLKNLVPQDMNLAPLSVGALTNGLTVQEMTAAYTAFANGGIYSSPRCITRVETYDGRILYENEVDRRIVFSPQTAYIVTDILTNLTGSAQDGSLGKIQVAAKSGTTNSFKDRWYMGYTPKFLAGIWWGYDLPEVNDNTHHINMWKDVMEKIHEAAGIKEASFTEPDGIVTTTYCSVSGMLPGPYCALDPMGSTVKTGKFKNGTQPTEVCTTHHTLYVCTASGQIAHDNCPAAREQVFRDVVRYYSTTIYVGDAEYVCPPLSPNITLYNSSTQPVYMYMVPEGMVPCMPSSRKGAYANALCQAHTPSSTPHYWTYNH